jgi:hypothetical protein
MNRQTIIISSAVAAILLLIGIGILVYGLSQGGSLPGLSQPTPTPTVSAFRFDGSNVEITPPPTLPVRHARGDSGGLP